MKGSVAAFMAAAIDFAAERGSAFTGTISLLLTCDEEGPAINGTRKVIAWLAAEGMVPDHCLLGEPTCLGQLGDTMKIGRRGSLSAAITALGKQGHSAYPQQFDNPIPKLVRAARSPTPPCSRPRHRTVRAVSYGHHQHRCRQ